MAISRKHTVFAVSTLFGVVVAQAIGYGFYTNVIALLRTASICGFKFNGRWFIVVVGGAYVIKKKKFICRFAFSC